MADLQIANFCELFGFNSKLNPVSRMNLKIESTLYPPGFEFLPGSRYGYFDIIQHIDDLALVYEDESRSMVLHMFVPEGRAPRTIINCQPEEHLYRYSKFEYIRDAYETGHMLIFSAIEYLKNEYDAARKDNELVHAKNVSASAVSITTQDGKPIVPIGDVTFSNIHLSLDTYILCFSYDYDEKFYEWFEGTDACLIIDNVPEFENRVFAAFEKAMPSHTGVNGRVTYGKHPSARGIMFSKPLTYKYQREHRFSWIPESSKRTITPEAIIKMNMDEIRPLIPAPVEIWAGSLKDISRIVRRPAV